MQEIVVDIVHAEVFKLLGKDRLDLILALQTEGGEFRGNGEGVAGITLYDCFARRFLALSVVVDVAGVEVGVARLDESIYHPVQFIVVEVGRVSVLYRKPHHPNPSLLFSAMSKLLSSHRLLPNLYSSCRFSSDLFCFPFAV